MRGLIDTHFHLDHYKNHSILYHYLEDEEQYTLCMTNSPGIYLSCNNIYGNGQYVKFAMGFHPRERGLGKKELKDFLYMLPMVNYVGEIGLDFSANVGVDQEFQTIAFEKIVKECSYQNKLMSVHIRNAHSVAVDIMNKYRPQKCIVHWFQGNAENLQRYIELGCYFSINTNMIEKNRDICMQIPKSRVLIESDGPYTKVDGKRFSPEKLFESYEIIARGIEEPDLIKIVFDNFKRILRE